MYFNRPTHCLLKLFYPIKKEISYCDYFLMNAAVSDFKISSKTLDKIPKSKIEKFFKHNFELVPDILREISESKKDNQIFVGFCAFTGSFEDAREIIRKKLLQKRCDYLFANPIDIFGQGFGSSNKNEGWLFDSKSNQECHIELTTKIDLANKLINKIISIDK